MNPQKFAQKISRLDRLGLSTSQGRNVLGRLVRQAGAAYVISHGKITGYRLPGGGMVCRKRRYGSADIASRELHHISTTSLRSHVPVRAYRCPDCAGYHLTSSA